MQKKRYISYLLIFLLLMSFCVPGVHAEENETLSVTKGCHSYDSDLGLLGSSQWTENAAAVFLYETVSQTVMYQWEADKQLYPASMVKIMTALLVMEKGILTDTVSVTQAALDSVSSDAITVDLQAGEKITVQDLMYCMLVESANDAAAVLAEYIAGSQDAFAAMMNDRASELGCTGTVFTNPHGLHDDNQLMTVRDLCKIMDAAIGFEEFRNFIGEIQYQVPATNLSKERDLVSNNYLMNNKSVGIYLDSRVLGGRIGETQDGLRNIVSLSQSGNMELICIVFHSASKVSDSGRTESYGGFPETLSLLNAAFDGYSRRQIIFPDQVLYQNAVLNGDNDLFVTSHQGFSTVLPSQLTLEQLTFTYDELPGGTQVPIKKGQHVGSLQVWHDSLCVAQTEVYAMNDVFAASQKIVSLKGNRDGISWLAVLIIIVVVIIAVFVIAVRKKNKKAVAPQTRRASSRRRR